MNQVIVIEVDSRFDLESVLTMIKEESGPTLEAIDATIWVAIDAGADRIIMHRPKETNR